MGIYIGVKLVKPVAMTRAEYNEYRGWELPEDENGEDEGVLVEHMDGGKPNHVAHKGYISWNPEEVFNGAYRSTEGMSFGLAIEAMRMGQKVARSGWNGKKMFIFNIANWDFETDVSGVDDLNVESFFCMKTAGDTLIPWLASQEDMKADDWCIVD